MGKKVDNLTDDQLRTWQNIRRQIWLFENVHLDPEQFTPAQAMSQYDLLHEFLEGAIREYDIDETKPFKISEATGLIYYLEDGDG